MNQIDFKRLEEAVKLLENPSWTAKITNIIGIPIEWAIKKLPKGASEIISRATEKAIRKALVIAVSTMRREYRGNPLNWLHRIGVMASGAGGGFFGLFGLVIELPISTVIMLRSITDIARSEGENIGNIETQLACLQVFALGGSRGSDNASETGYYAVRIALSRAITEAGEFIVEKGFVEEGAPVIVRLIARITSRFGVVVSEKAAAEAVPIVGAAGGATINLLFINHFQSMARGHFIVRSLERKLGQDVIKNEYEKIAKNKLYQRDS